MTLTAEEIERIVQEVIRRLAAAEINNSNSNSNSKPQVQSQAALELEDQLVTLATIEGRLNGIQQLVVSPKAVVTPSVRDELRDKNVEFVRMSKS